MKWLALVAQAVDKLPLERLLVRRSDEKERLQDLAKILGDAHSKPAGAEPEQMPDLPEEIGENTHPANLGNTRPKVRLEANPSVTSTVSTKETVDYQNREIGKLLVTLKKHMTQKFIVAGKPCDCGQKHMTLELEYLCEETIPMVENSDVYYRILSWNKEIAPKCMVEAVASGQYNTEYPVMARQARDFQKEIMGTPDVSVLYPKKTEKQQGTSQPEDAQEITEEEFEKQHKALLTRGTII